MMALSYRSVTPRRIALAHSILVLALLAVLAVGRAAPAEAAPTPVGVVNPMPSAVPAAIDPARQAYSASFTQSSTGSLNVSFGTVPAGKRLVIESESVLCSISGGAQILYAYMYTNFGRTYLLLQKMGSANGFDYYSGTFTNTMYGDHSGMGTGDITFFLQSSTYYPGAPALHCTGSIVGHNATAPPH